MLNFSFILTFQAKYTDPQTQLRFSLAEEFQTIRTMPGDIIAGYLALRKAANPVG
jgi:YL1 nuclear protein C-terminal domain